MMKEIALRIVAGILMGCLGTVGNLGAQAPTPDWPTIYRDGYGVPHVFGPTDASVAFGAAWVQAEEDWQMVEQNFARASGRGAELLGRGALTNDYIARALEIPRLSREEYERSSPRMRELLDAYADGFNAYLAAHPEERKFLDRVEPWHTLALIRFKYHQLEFLAYGGFEEGHLERLLESGWPVGGEGSDSSGWIARSVRTRCAAACSGRFGSRLFSKRAEASVRRPSRAAVRRIVVAWKLATSSSRSECCIPRKGICYISRIIVED